jgi:hypothetical protein
MSILMLAQTQTATLALVLLALWVVLWGCVLWECMAKERDQQTRQFWAYTTALGVFFGAALYLLYRRPRRIAEWGE